MVHTAATLADPVTVTIGSAPVTVTYAGVTGIGLFQLHVTVAAVSTQKGV
jgi:uncharacterized protein (TIGR03437 family)